jgi:hypothetical protein
MLFILGYNISKKFLFLLGDLKMNKIKLCEKINKTLKKIGFMIVTKEYLEELVGNNISLLCLRTFIINHPEHSSLTLVKLLNELSKQK